MPTALDTNSKADTVFLCTYPAASVANLATDISQYRTNLTNGTTYAYEASSSRTAIVTPERTIEVKFEHTPGNSDILLNHGTTDGVSYTYRLDIQSDTVRFQANGSTLAGVALDGAFTRTYLVRWAIRLLSGTTYRSEMGVYNTTDGVWTWTFEDHAAHTTNATWQFNIGGYGAGISIYTGGATAMTMVRISARYHSRSEAAEDWIATSTPAAQTGVTRCGSLPVASSSTLGDHGAFAGPALLIAGGATRNNDRRFLGPLVNARLSSSCVLDYSYAPSSWVRKAIGSSLFRWRIDLLWWAYCPPAATHARVRLHVKQTQTAGSPLPIFLRMYSLNRLPQTQQIQQQPQEPIELYWIGNTVNTDHAGTGGAWVDLGILRLARFGPSLQTFLALAWHVNSDAGATDEQYQQLQINSVVVDAFTKPTASNKFGDYDLELG